MSTESKTPLPTVDETAVPETFKKHVNPVLINYATFDDGKVKPATSSLCLYYELADLECDIVGDVSSLDWCDNTYTHLIPSHIEKSADGEPSIVPCSLEDAITPGKTGDGAVPPLLLVMVATDKDLEANENTAPFAIKFRGVPTSDSVKFVGCMQDKIVHSNHFANRYAYLSAETSNLSCTTPDVKLNSVTICGPDGSVVRSEEKGDPERVEYGSYEYFSENARMYLDRTNFFLKDFTTGKTDMLTESFQTPFPLIQDIVSSGLVVWEVVNKDKVVATYWLGTNGHIWKVVDGLVIGMIRFRNIQEKPERLIHHVIRKKDEDDVVQKSMVMASDQLGNLYLFGQFMFTRMNRRLNFSTDEYSNVQLVAKGSEILVCRMNDEKRGGVVGRLTFDKVISHERRE